MPEPRSAQSKLLLKPAAADFEGRIHNVTPENAGWDFVGFAMHRLATGQRLARETGGREHCLVLLSGKVGVTLGDQDFGTAGGRASPFEPDPWSLYIPAGSRWTVTAEGPCEIAICSAPGTIGARAARIISPRDVETVTRGRGSNTRHVRNILPETEPADSLLVVEVVTPAGCWSSYPPHKHDEDRLPAESRLEETYYHRLNPSQGFGFQRVYTDDRSLDETLSFSDGDVVLVPRGYHPVAAPHGYDLYYLNVMAGPKRSWKFHNDPAHQWMLGM